MTDQARFERFQALLRAAYLSMADMHFTGGPPDAYFFTAFREHLLRAGARQDDMRRVANWLIWWMGRESRRESVEPLIDLIAEHLLVEDLEVGFDRECHVTMVVFPNAQLAH